jgi:hypothetical protein
MYSYSAKSKIHTFKLQHGQTVAMASAPGSDSFQKLAVHGVHPESAKSTCRGWRMNLTVRTMSKDLQKNPLDSAYCSSRYAIGEGCEILLWDNLFSAQEISDLQNVLLQTIHNNGVPDVTRLFGQEYTNKGRKVIEMASTPNFKYHYGGKTVTGIQYPNLIRELVVPRMSGVFGVLPETIWFHLVYYPTPDCKLDMHDDGEDGINPHMIMSITFLEDPIRGARRFRVRLKSSYPSGFNGSKKKAGDDDRQKTLLSVKSIVGKSK